MCRGCEIHSWLPLCPFRGCSRPPPCWICVPGAYPVLQALRTRPPCSERSGCAAAWLCSVCSSALRLQVPPSAVPGASPSPSAASPRWVARGTLTWQTALACFAGGGWLCSAVCSCMRLVSRAALGLCASRDRAHGCCEANSWPFPHCKVCKSINCKKKNIQGHMG